jgi:AcrR family transcriptional regulator
MATKAPSKIQKSTQRTTQGTSEKILESARTLFVQHGFSGTSMGQIATKAGVNHSLLFHHFGNKEKLWQEVKQAIVEEGKSVYSNLPSLDQPLEPFLSELIARAITFYKNNPDIVRMVSWQRLEIKTDQPIGITLSKESLKWLEAVQHFQKTGEMNPALKPECVITMVWALVGSIAMDPNIFIADPENNKLFITFCAQSLYKALKNDPV